MNKGEANKKINELVKQAYDNIKQAEELADAHGIDFGFSVAYGMGGHYNPDIRRKSEWEGDPSDYDWYESDEYGEEGGYWRASSQSC